MQRIELTSIEKLLVVFLIAVYIVSVMFFSYTEGMSVYTKLVAVLVILCTGYLVVRLKRLPLLPPTYKMIIAWLVYASIGMLVAVNQAATFAKLLTVFQVIGISILLSNAIVQTRQFEAPWFIFLLSTVCVSIYTLLNKTQLSSFDGRLNGTFGNANMFGLVLLVAMLYGLYFIVSHRHWIYKLFVLGLMSVIFYTLIQTGSRKAIVGLFLIGGGFTFFYIWFLAKRNIGKALFVFAAAISLLAAGLTYVANSDHAHRFQRIFDSYTSGNQAKLGASEKGRIQLLSKGIEETLNNPVMGVGLDNFKFLTSSGVLGGVGVYSHANYIEVAVSTGLIGLFIYYGAISLVFFKLVKRIKRSYSAEEQYFFGFNLFILFMSLIYDFAMVSYYEKTSWLVLGMVIASTYRIFPQRSPKRYAGSV